MRSKQLPSIEEIRKKYPSPTQERTEEFNRILKFQRADWRKNIEKLFARSRYINYIKSDETFTSPKDIPEDDINSLITLYKLIKNTINTLMENSTEETIEEMKRARHKSD